MSAFNITFACGNCGNTWIESFEKGDSVSGGGMFSGPYLTSSKCTGSSSCQHCRHITCPVCDAEKGVQDIKRRPT